MCGIIGYTGTEKAVPILLGGLKTLEYRGYDSAGIAVKANQDIKIIKACGRISQLEQRLAALPKINGVCGIGHTRWATHGAPIEDNAHPHYSGAVTLVHNGIIENYGELTAMLKAEGFSFYSQTDTEVAAKLIDLNYRRECDPLRAIFKAIRALNGSYALGIIFSDIKDTIFAVRKDSPLIVAPCSHGSLVASDIPAIAEYSNTCYRLPEGIVATLTGEKVTFTDDSLSPVVLKQEVIDTCLDKAEKNGFEHFMLKEIYEEPKAFEQTVKSVAQLLEKESNLHPRRIHVVACGTAMHAGLVGKSLIERFTRIPVEVTPASEFRYSDPILEPEDLVVLISQSGETADTLAALRHAKDKGIYTLAIVNVKGSAIANEANSVLYTLAGTETAVASTKAYTVQCAVLYMLALRLSVKAGRKGEAEYSVLVRKMVKDVARIIGEALKLSDTIRHIADRYKDAADIFFIGRGIDAALCAEGSLKLKEISYIHCEGYAAGELKHGTISLIEQDVPVVAVMTVAHLAEKMISAIREVKSRGARVLCICTGQIAKNNSIPADDIIVIPETDEFFAPFPAATVLQLFAYHVADLKGLDVDKPRNLAKSVTVE